MSDLESLSLHSSAESLPSQRPLFLEAGAAPAHPEDSLALAEHVDPADIGCKIARITEILISYNELLLKRAHHYYELALSTPAIDQDMTYFERADQDLAQIARSDLPPRHRVRFNADLLGIYREAFVARAFDDPITPEIHKSIEHGISAYSENFITDVELNANEQGQLAELVGIGYLLNGDHFPFIGLHREESNVIAEDNHDVYTIITPEDGEAFKAPISIKFRTLEHDTELISLPIGRIALATARAIPTYALGFTGGESHRKSAEALRLAADILICRAHGEDLDVDEKAFLWTMTANVQAPIATYIENYTPPDYAANAEVIRDSVGR